MIDFGINLESSKVKLRLMENNDFNHYLSITGDASMWKYFTHDLSNPEELKAWTKEAMIGQNKKTRIPFIYNYILILITKDDNW